MFRPVQSEHQLRQRGFTGLAGDLRKESEDTVQGRKDGQLIRVLRWWWRRLHVFLDLTIMLSLEWAQRYTMSLSLCHVVARGEAALGQEGRKETLRVSCAPVSQRTVIGASVKHGY